MKLFKNTYLSLPFFICFIGVVLLFTISFMVKPLFLVSQVLLLTLIAATVLDIFILFRIKKPIKARRNHSQVLSLGDENKIRITLTSNFNYKVKIEVIDELPEQFQIRDFSKTVIPKTGRSEQTIEYTLNPKQRGIYTFGNINLFMSSQLRLAERRITIPQKKDVPVYPSIIQMKNFELMALTSISHFQGIKKN